MRKSSRKTKNRRSSARKIRRRSTSLNLTLLSYLLAQNRSRRKSEETTFSRIYEDGSLVTFTVDTSNHTIKCESNGNSYFFKVDPKNGNIFYNGKKLCHYNEVASGNLQGGAKLSAKPMRPQKLKEEVAPIGFFSKEILLRGFEHVIKGVAKGVYQFIFWLIKEFLLFIWTSLKVYFFTTGIIGVILYFMVPGETQHFFTTLVGWMWDPNQVSITDVIPAGVHMIGSAFVKIFLRYVGKPLYDNLPGFVVVIPNLINSMANTMTGPGTSYY